MKPPPPAIAWPAALRLGVVLCAAELVLTRITGGERVAPVTVASAVGAALLLAGVPGALLDLLPQPPRLRYALHSLFGWGLCALIGLGIVGPVVLEVSGRGAALAAGLALLGLIAALSLSFRGAVHSPYPPPAARAVPMSSPAATPFKAQPGRGFAKAAEASASSNTGVPQEERVIVTRGGGRP